jgi:two-component system sensor histidine kinase AlgZ
VKISEEQRLPSFWQLQAGGWIVYFCVLLLSFLPSKELRGDLFYRLVFCGICFLASFPLHWICRRLWQKQAPWPRIVRSVALSCYVLGLICGTLLLWLEAKYLMPQWEKFEWPFIFANALSPTFVLALWSSMYFGIKHYGAQAEERERLLHLESLVREAELKALQYQIHPHFLFNTLNSISTLVYERDTATANRMIARLADFLRATLDDDGAYEVPLRDELDITRLYLEIEKTRLGERLIVIEETDPSLLDAAVPRLLLQPLVENAVRHGIAKRRDGGELFMTAFREGEDLVIRVQNDLMALNGKPCTYGIGLTNIRTRLQQLYGEQHQFTIDFSAGDMCKVTIKIPLHIYAAPVELAAVEVIENGER